MGIFDIFRPKTITSPKPSAGKDERKAECPYCRKALPKIPGAKTKCLHCGEFMFVRTRPKDNARVVVTKEEADKISEDWAIMSGTHDYFMAEKEAFKQERDILRKRFGREPGERDIKWGLLNKELIKHMRNGDWGLYRNARFQMAEILRSEMKLKEALRTYFEVCYFDLNGARNTGGLTDPKILKDFPVFDPKTLGFLAPGIVDIIRRIMPRLGLAKDEARQMFIEHNSHNEKFLKLPLVASEAWVSLEKELQQDV